MIGNDIVEWKQASRDSNWQRRGFLSKLFTLSEQQFIHEASYPEQMVWTLWSLKESVYKANLRQTGQRRFAPRQIQCQLQPAQNGVMEGTATYEFIYGIKASLSPNYVSSIAVLSSLPFTVQELIINLKSTDYTEQHTQLYQCVTHYCTTALAYPDGAAIQKDDKGIPSLLVTRASTPPLRLPISLSHHGHYGAFIIGGSNFLESYAN